MASAMPRELAARPRMLARAARGLSRNGRAKLGEDHLLPLDTLKAIGGSALTDDMKIEMGENGLPTTFVPGRNLMFLTAAAALGYRRGIADLVGGMCETDFSGYPDCRDETIQATAKALSLGLARDVRIHTPLMWIDKAATWTLAEELGGEALVDLIVEETVTCYEGDRTQRHDWGYGCGACPACELRADGLREVPRPHDLSRQGNLLHAAGRGRADRPRRGVPALCRLQSVERAGAGPRRGGLPVLRHRFRRHRRPGRRQIRRRAERWRGRWRRNGRRRAGQALCRLHRRRTAAAARRGADRGAARAGFEIGIETNGTLLPPPGIDWICVSPKADAEQKLMRGDELKLIYPQDGARAGALCRPGFPQLLPAADGQSGPRRQHRGRDALLPGASAMAAVAADPQAASGYARRGPVAPCWRGV